MEAAGPIPRKKVRAQRGPQSVFPKMRFPEKRFSFISRRRRETLPRGSLRRLRRKFDGMNLMEDL